MLKTIDQVLTASSAKVRCFLQRLAKDTQATAMLETALVTPVILSLALGGAELASNMTARKQVNEIARAVADNASRISEGSTIGLGVVRESDIHDIFEGARLQGENLDFISQGRIIVSSLERNSDGGQWIHWQRCYGSDGFNSEFTEGMGRRGRSFAGIKIGDQTITAAANDAVMYVEVFYRYEPIISADWAGYSEQVITAKHAMNVRDKRNLTGIAPDFPGATCS